MDHKYIFYPFLLVLFLSACNQVKETEEEKQEDIQKAQSEFMLTHAQLEVAGIEYGNIAKHRLSSDVNARGELILPVNAKADLVTLYPGIIKTALVNTGDRVSKGQVLAILNSPEFIQAQQQYLMVKNQLLMLEGEYERQQELNKDKISSDKYFQKAQSDYEVALAEKQGLGMQLKMAGISLEKLDEGQLTPELQIIATMNGYVEEHNANPGKYVMKDECMMTIINRQKLLLELSIFEKDILKIEPGQRVTFSLANLSRENYEATIVTVGNMVQEENRVVKVLAEFANENSRMLPGMFVAAEIHTDEETLDALPSEAVAMISTDRPVIFYTTPGMQTDEGTYFKTAAVKTGFEEEGHVAITLLEEIPADALIVVKGAYYLKTEMARQSE